MVRRPAHGTGTRSLCRLFAERHARSGLGTIRADALDEIQYLTGAPNTTWGAKRAADGHPAPFPLHYVEIGNEDFFDRSGSYDARFAEFYDAIKAAYPNLQVIATTGVTSRTPDIIDEHYYLVTPGRERFISRW